MLHINNSCFSCSNVGIAPHLCSEQSLIVRAARATRKGPIVAGSHLNTFCSASRTKRSLRLIVARHMGDKYTAEGKKERGEKKKKKLP